MDLPLSLIAAFAGPLGATSAVALVALIMLREAVPDVAAPGVRRWRSLLTVATAALLVPFALFIAARLALLSAPAAVAGFPATATVGRTIAAEPTPVGPPSPGPIPGGVATPQRPGPGAGPGTPLPAAPGPATPVEVANAVGGLRSGQFEVELRYSNGARSTTLLAFDLGGTSGPPRLHSRTTYQGTTGTLTTERIVVGDRSWTRQAGGPWSLANTAQNVPDEVWPFLPLPGAALSSAQPDGPGALRWYDPTRNADLRLALDANSGLPGRLEQTTRGNGTMLTVIYRGWNTPVAIAPPTDR